MASAVHTQKGSINRNLHVDLVRVDGRYRIGKLLGAGGSGMTNSGSTSTLCSELSRDGLCRERYQDGNRGCCEDRTRRQLFEAQA